MATMITHGPTACLGINADAAAVTEPDLFAESLVAGFTEVLSLAPEPGRSPRSAERTPYGDVRLRRRRSRPRSRTPPGW